jgi:membrane protein DedA with SNARE-associated domain
MISAMTFFDATLVQSLIANYGYSAVFVVVMLESSGFPVPGETVLVCASVYSGSRHGLSIGAIIAAAACGAILGDNVGFRVGRRFGRTLLLKYGHRIGISERELILGEYLFQRYGAQSFSSDASSLFCVSTLHCSRERTGFTPFNSPSTTHPAA